MDDTKITKDTEDIMKFQNARDKHRILQVLERKNPKGLGSRMASDFHWMLEDSGAVNLDLKDK